MWRVSANPVNPAEAIAWFRSRVPLTREQWDALQQRARRRAFTVSRVAALDIIADVWASLLEALEQGTPYNEWARDIRETLESAWGKRNSARLENIFRTNVQMAYSSGRWAQMENPEIKASRPYRMYDAILDNRTTAICRERHGTILPADDVWWRNNWPPLHFNCRSGVRALTEQQAQQRSIKRPGDRSQALPGFGSAPDSWEWEPEPDRWPLEIQKIYRRVAR